MDLNNLYWGAYPAKTPGDNTCSWLFSDDPVEVINKADPEIGPITGTTAEEIRLELMRHFPSVSDAVGRVSRPRDVSYTDDNGYNKGAPGISVFSNVKVLDEEISLGVLLDTARSVTGVKIDAGNAQCFYYQNLEKNDRAQRVGKTVWVIDEEFYLDSYDRIVHDPKLARRKIKAWERKKAQVSGIKSATISDIVRGVSRTIEHLLSEDGITADNVRVSNGQAGSVVGRTRKALVLARFLEKRYPDVDWSEFDNLVTVESYDWETHEFDPHQFSLESHDPAWIKEHIDVTEEEAQRRAADYLRNDKNRVVWYINGTKRHPHKLRQTLREVLKPFEGVTQDDLPEKDMEVVQNLREVARIVGLST